MGRKRKRSDSELTPEELKRRNLQREKQKIALARQAGQHVPSKKAQKAAAWRAELSGKAQEKVEAEKQKREELGSKHDIVVVPIFWKKREDEAERIKSAARNIKSRLAAHKVDCWIDQRHKYTPGQKFAYWEHLGVMLRIELGPKDLEQATCSLCRVHTAGDHMSVDRLRDVPLAGEALFDGLRKLGLSKLEGKRDGNAPKSRPSVDPHCMSEEAEEEHQNEAEVHDDEVRERAEDVAGAQMESSSRASGESQPEMTKEERRAQKKEDKKLDEGDRKKEKKDKKDKKKKKARVVNF